MPNYDVVAAHDVPHYGAFRVEAATPAEALAAAGARLRADTAILNDPEPEGAHSLRIVSLQLNDQDPLFWDVSLDREAPFWPGRDVAAALRRSTRLLADVIASLEEAAEFRAELDQMEANLRLLGGDVATALAARRRSEPPDRWVEAVQNWGLAPG
jgi:hypothetical protein